MVWCDRPHAFMRLYKPHTIEDNNVLCHATVAVSGINLLKSRGISAYWRACALYACIVITCSRGGSTKYSRHSCSWSIDQGKLLIAYLCSRLRIWSRETGSDIPTGFLPLLRRRAHSFNITPLAIGPIRSLSGHATDMHRRCIKSGTTHYTLQRTAAAAGRLIALCTYYLQPWHRTAHGLQSFRACKTKRMQLAGCCSSVLPTCPHFVPKVVVGKIGPY